MILLFFVFSCIAQNLGPQPKAPPEVVGSASSASEFALCLLPHGGFVLAWTMSMPWSVFLQRFDEVGAIGAIVTLAQIPATHPNVIDTLNVASLTEAGNFVVSWFAREFSGTTGLTLATTQHRLFGPTGVRLGGDVELFRYTQLAPLYTKLVALDGLGLVAMGVRQGRIFAQQLDASGGLLGREFNISTTSPLNIVPMYTASSFGSVFCVAFLSDGGVYGRGFTGGTPLGASFRVDSSMPPFEIHPEVAVASLNDGTAVFAWASSRLNGIYGQRVVVESGAKVGTELHISTNTTAGKP